MDWVEFKDYLSQVTELSEDALHIYVAILVQFVAAFLLRRPIAHPLPWLCVLAFLLVNEALDLRQPGRPVEEWQILGSIQDLWNTMALPTVLLLLARYAPALLTGRRLAAAPVRSPGGRQP